MIDKLIDTVLKPQVIAFIKGHLNDDPFSLSLQGKKSNVENWQESVLQIQSRQKAFKKLPSFAENFKLVFPKPLSVEQSSSETTAEFKSTLLKGHTFADLTGGMGIDTYYLSKAFDNGVYVDSDPQLCALARHNFSALGKPDIEVIHAGAEEFLASSERFFDLIYMDPSRRDEGQKRVFKIEECLPDVIKLEDLILDKADNALIKLSPLADIKHACASFNHLKKVWVISVKNECKELLLWLRKGEYSDLEVEAVNLLTENEIERLEFAMGDEEKAYTPLGMPLTYIYEPNASILKSGAFKLTGEKFGLLKLHRNTHLYSSVGLIDFPGRIFRLEKILKLDKKLITKEFSGTTVNIITRNFHFKPEQVAEKFRLKNGDGKYLIGTTLADNSRVILCCERIR